FYYFTISVRHLSRRFNIRRISTIHFEIRSLVFDKLLTYETKKLRTDWQESIFIMEDYTLAVGLYKIRRIIFSVAPEEIEMRYGHFTYYLPINDTVTLEENEHFSFIDSLHIVEALVLRQADQLVDFHADYEKVKGYAVEQDIPLEDTFYCVLLEVYGDYIIDLHVPVKDRSGEQ